MRASSLRNENVPVHQIDNNAIKEANIRLGSNTTLVKEATADRSYFATEFGRPPGALLLLDPPNRQPPWHAELYDWHQNSVFNARTFFQAGPVKPSHRNHYGGRFSTGLRERTWLAVDGFQRKIRGMVNGNVLVPLASERTPRARDPQAYALIARWLAAYKPELPNRPDFDIRALNTNSPQRIDETGGSGRLDVDLQQAGRLALSYQLNRLHIDAFQFVAGQNPNTDIHTHRAQISHRLVAGPDTEIGWGFSFQRVKSLLQPEPNAVGPRVRIGFQIEELGPDAEFPINRAANTYRFGGQVNHRPGTGNHTLSAGGDALRLQLNGIETNNQRGFYSFTNNFGRTAIENLLLGTPSFYEITMGELARGFRNWMANAFFADRWQAHPQLQLYLGLRYSMVTAPTEVDRLNVFPFGCDCNNVSPRFSLAWQAGAGWVVRTMYTVSFSEIPQVTYQQIRNNPPLVRYVQVQNPDLLDPLRGVNLGPGQGRHAPTIFASNMVSVYAHQYSLSLERRVGGESMLRLGYIGDKSLKLINGFILNRADPVPGIPLTLDTVDARRPDPRYFEIYSIGNGGQGNLNAGQVTFDSASYRGLRGTLSYTFGKSIDEGSDYTGTAANRDLLRARSQWQYESFGDRRGLSTFDSAHALLASFTYDLPRPVERHGTWSILLNDWQVAGVALYKSGTPFTLYLGSDAPGFGNVDGGPGDRPNILDPSILGRTIGHPDTAPKILSRERFAFILPGEGRGSVGRNTFRKSSIANLNAAVTKQFHWGGSREWTALFRAETYNLANTPQFDEPARNLTTPSFGKITNTLNDGRVFQLGLRLIL